VGRRPQRLGKAIREEVARMLLYELKDPRLGLVTVTRVELSGDLAHARVHVSVLGDERERRASLAALARAAGFVRRELARRLQVRHVPEIDFRYDKGLEATERVARLLEEQRAAERASPTGEEAREAQRAAGQDGPGTSDDGREP
jgi:ribosome-binding factor A